MRSVMRTMVEQIDADKAAWVIEEFARWVSQTPGVWSVTVRKCELKGSSVDLHLIVHADLEDDGKSGCAR